MLVVIGMLAVLLAIGAVQVRFSYRRRKLFAQNWDSILLQMEAVDLASLRGIADRYLKVGKDQLRIDPLDMWTAVGGLNGLRRMRRNSETVLQLAIYAERWNTENGRVVSELIRRDAMRLNQSIRKIESAMFYPYGLIREAFSLQEAISSYWQMRERLLGLYEVAQVGLIPCLEAVM